MKMSRWNSGGTGGLETYLMRNHGRSHTQADRITAPLAK